MGRARTSRTNPVRTESDQPMKEQEITEADLQVAAQALAKCAAYDPWFPQPNRATVLVWAEQIALWKLNLEDVLDGVRKMYSDNGSGFRPLPKDLIEAARFVRSDRCQRETEDERRAREDRQDVALERRNRLAELTGGFGKAIDA